MNRSVLAVPVAAAAALAAWQYLPDGGDVPPEPVVPYTDAARGAGWFDDSWSPGVSSNDPFDSSGVLGDLSEPEGAAEADDEDAVGEGDDEDEPAQPNESAAPPPAPVPTTVTTTTTVAVLTIDDGADVPEIDDLPDGDR